MSTSERRWASSRITDTAFGTVMVISTAGIPPAEMASTARLASSTEEARTTGIIPISPIRRITSSALILLTGIIRFRSALDSGRARRHGLLDFRQRGHGGIAGGCHRQCTVRRTALHRPLRIFAGQKSVDQSRSERVTTPDAIVYLQILTDRSFIKLSIVIAKSSPVVAGRCFRSSQRGRDHRHGWIFLHDSANHFGEACSLQVGVMLVQAGDGKAQ